MRLRSILTTAVTALALVVPLSAQASYHEAETDPGFQTGSCKLEGAISPGSGGVKLVNPAEPSAFKKIGDAVAAASEGDTILVSPGTYKESVTVSTPGLRIRGTDRNAVILDGESGRQYGFLIIADRVIVENMTAHHYVGTAFYWTHVTGYWGRYLTAYNNGDYGLYAYNARCGQFDHSFGSGNADSAFYVGECYPCDGVLHDLEATENGLGYSGTNAGGNLVLRDSKWWNNGLGIVPNSLDSEERPPQRGVTIKNNLIYDNNNKVAPGRGLTGQFFGGGIVIAGGQGNSVYGNTVTDHALAGIALAPLPDSNVWIPSGNVVWGNTVQHDPYAYPDGVDLAQAAASGPNNCWELNDFGNSAPVLIESVWDCGLSATPPGGDPRVERALFEGAAGLNGRDPSDWRTWPAPSAQPNQPDDNGNGDYSDDGPADQWLPALGL